MVACVGHMTCIKCHFRIKTGSKCDGRKVRWPEWWEQPPQAGQVANAPTTDQAREFVSEDIEAGVRGCVRACAAATISGREVRDGVGGLSLVQVPTSLCISLSFFSPSLLLSRLAVRLVVPGTSKERNPPSNRSGVKNGTEVSKKFVLRTGTLLDWIPTICKCSLLASIYSPFVGFPIRGRGEERSLTSSAVAIGSEVRWEGSLTLVQSSSPNCSANCGRTSPNCPHASIHHPPSRNVEPCE